MKKKVSYVANDNSEHTTELACREHDASLDGRSFLCPACKGFGTENGEPIWRSVLDEEATGQAGSFAREIYKKVIVAHKQVPCSVCDGHGWTEAEQVPVISKEVIGWQDNPDEPRKARS